MADGILEALFGLEFGHADDADFLVVIFLMGLKEKAQPGDVTSAGWANKKEKR